MGVRKCDPGENNAFLVAFSIAFVEHLARVTTPIEELREIMQEVSGGSAQSDYPAIDMTLRGLYQRRQERHSVVAWMKDNSGNSEFWNSFPDFIRYLCFRRLEAHSDTLDFLGGVSKTRILASLTHPDLDETSEHQMKLLATLFRLKLLIFSPDDINHIKSHYDPDIPGKDVFKLHLFQSRNVFHCLYTQAELYAEGYDLDLDREMQPDGEGYITQQLQSRHRERKSLPCRVSEDLKSLQAHISALLRFIKSSEDFIKSVFQSFKHTEFFVGDSISAHTSLAIREYERNIKLFTHFQANIESEFVGNTTKLLLCPATLQSVFNEIDMTQLMKLCLRCQTKTSEVILDCTHAFCKTCIFTELQRMITSNLLFLKPNGETMDDFVCPRMDCYIRINGRKLREILGEEYVNKYVEYVGNYLEMKECQRCGKVRGYAKFRVLCECRAPLCLFCYSDLCRSNNSRCICGASLPEKCIDYLKNQEVHCSGCSSYKSMLMDYSNIECNDHITCQDCLMNAEKRDKRCKYCYRRYTLKELADIRALGEKKCVFCDRNCRSSRLTTTCGCIICLPCANTKALTLQVCSNCYSCNKPLPEAGYNQLIFLLVPIFESSLSLSTCKLCNFEIEDARKMTLQQCKHEFHPECLERHWKGVFKERPAELTCPCEGCRGVVTSAELVGQVDLELKETQSRPPNSIKCPGCGREVIVTGESGATKSYAVCTTCEFRFCLKCRESFDQTHNPENCDFLELKLAVSAAEKAAAPGYVVIQCPACKKPNTFQKELYKVTCQNKTCGVHFCGSCAVPSYLYTMHRDGYHRPDCRYYDPSIPPKRVDVCRHCQQVPTYCSPPQKLKVPKRFDRNES